MIAQAGGLSLEQDEFQMSDELVGHVSTPRLISVPAKSTPFLLPVCLY
jgi:hypothetical protein